MGKEDKFIPTDESALLENPLEIDKDEYFSRLSETEALLVHKVVEASRAIAADSPTPFQLAVLAIGGITRNKPRHPSQDIDLMLITDTLAMTKPSTISRLLSRYQPQSSPREIAIQQLYDGLFNQLQHKQIQIDGAKVTCRSGSTAKKIMDLKKEFNIPDIPRYSDYGDFNHNITLSVPDQRPLHIKIAGPITPPLKEYLALERDQENSSKNPHPFSILHSPYA